MQLLVMGADNFLGKEAATRFSDEHQVRAGAWTTGEGREHSAGGVPVTDPLQPDEIQSLVAGIDAILYLSTWSPEGTAVPKDSFIERATLAPYRLLQAARTAGVKRVVLGSTLRLFDAYPASCVIDEQWRPRPQPDPSSLAPYLCEQTCREFAREGPIAVIALRFDPLEIEKDRDIALSAIENALTLPITVPGYRWQVFHIAESDRYATRQARIRLGWAGVSGRKN